MNQKLSRCGKSKAQPAQEDMETVVECEVANGRVILREIPKRTRDMQEQKLSTKRRRRE